MCSEVDMLSNLLKRGLRFVDEEYLKLRYKPVLEETKALSTPVHEQRLIFENYVSDYCHVGRDSEAAVQYHFGYDSIEGIYHTFIKSLDQELQQLGKALREGKKDEVRSFLGILESAQRISDDVDSFSRYRRLFYHLASKYEGKQVEIIGTPFQDTILDMLVKRDDFFTSRCTKNTYDEIGESVREEFRSYARNLRKVYDFNPLDILKSYITLLGVVAGLVTEERSFSAISPFYRSLPSIDSFRPIEAKVTKKRKTPDEVRNDEKRKLEVSIKRVIAAQSSWDNLDRIIANAFNDTSSLRDTLLFQMGMDRDQNIMLVPKPRRKMVDLDELIGYDAQKRDILQNTERLVAGEDANNVFLYGIPGTGKSSMINALLTRFGDRNLRVVEIPKQHAPLLPAVFGEIEQRSEYKFIVLIDEFDVRQDKELYEAIKTIMEGSFDSLPANARLHVISNYKDCMRTVGFKSDSEDEDAYRALEDRFGLALKFDYPSESERRKILEHYLGDRYQTIGETEITDKLQAYCSSRRIKQANPRNLRDFVKTL